MIKNKSRGSWESTHNQFSDSRSTIKNTWGKKKFSARATGIALAAVLISAGSCVANAQATAYQVFVEGESIGYVQDAAMADTIVTNLNNEAKAKTGKDNAYRVEDLEIKPVKTLATKMDVTECAAKIQTKCSKVSLSGATITINDKTIDVESKKIAEKALADYKAQYTNIDGATVVACDFKETVNVSAKDVGTGNALNYDQTMAFLKEGNVVTTTDTVKEEEKNNAQLVAANRGTTIETLDQLNEGTDLNTLAPGDVITTTVKAPVLTVTTTISRNYTEAIPFETQEEQDAEMDAGTEEVLQEGVEGAKDVDAVITYDNGVETSKVVNAEKVTKEAVPCIKKVGTKETAKSMTTAHAPTTGSGTFWMPADGSIGEIYRDGDSGSNHNGGCAVDILNAEGTPIYASAAGTVTRAGSYGGYGNCNGRHKGAGIPCVHDDDS